MVHSVVYANDYNLNVNFAINGVTYTDFIRLREGGHPVVDKTIMIGRAMSDRTNKAILLCRPPGFGKSLILSMLDAFLNIRYKGNTWFDGMRISDDRGSDAFRNAFPVIRIDLNTVSVEDQDELEDSMDRLVGSAFRDHSYLESSERLLGYMRSDYSRTVRNEGHGSDGLGLVQLSEMLHVHHGVPAVVLVDGYDSPVVSSIGRLCFLEARDMTGWMLLPVLKDNSHVCKAFMMGVCRVPYPGLNNLSLSTTMDGRGFADCLGMTMDEVRVLCDSAGQPEAVSDTITRCGGYRISEFELCNTRMVMDGLGCNASSGGCLFGHSLPTWLEGALRDADGPTRHILSELLSGEAVRIQMDRWTVFPLSGDMSEMNPSSLFSMLVQWGPMTAVSVGSGEFEVKVPNIAAEGRLRSFA